MTENSKGENQPPKQPVEDKSKVVGIIGPPLAPGEKEAIESEGGKVIPSKGPATGVVLPKDKK
ncbi:MAG: hypothetical protein Q7S61_00055 [bacterium]|nr:hypothetical protein [bacterium]